MHVAERKDADEWHAFPHARRMLARWELIDPNASTAASFDKLGVEIAKIEIEPQEPVRGRARLLEGRPSNLMALATPGREGPPR